MISINRNQLKYIAIVAMLIDHIAWAFVPTMSVLGQLLHFVGRLTGPIMAYMLAEGYKHTRSVKKYGIRLFIFALISWIPYSLFEKGKWPAISFGVIWTLFLGLIAIYIWDRSNDADWKKITVVVILCIISCFGGDWMIFDIIWPLFLFIYWDDEKKKWMSYIIIMTVEVALAQIMAIESHCYYRQLFQFGAFLDLPLLMKFYNGKPGSKKAFHKWFFYIFYPLHLLVLALIKIYCFN